MTIPTRAEVAAELAAAKRRCMDAQTAGSYDSALRNEEHVRAEMTERILKALYEDTKDCNNLPGTCEYCDKQLRLARDAATPLYEKEQP